MVLAKKKNRYILKMQIMPSLIISINLKKQSSVKPDADTPLGTLNLCLFMEVGDVQWFQLILHSLEDLISKSILLCMTFTWIFFSSYKDSLVVKKPTSSCQANLGNISSLNFTVWKTLIIHWLVYISIHSLFEDVYTT